MIKPTEQAKFEEICKFIRYNGVKLRLCKTRNRAFDGTYANNTITIYYHPEKNGCSDVASLLLHEFGHHLCTQSVGFWEHSEADAWNVGGQSVPKQWLPSTFLACKKYGLQAYRRVGIDPHARGYDAYKKTVRFA